MHNGIRSLETINLPNTSHEAALQQVRTLLVTQLGYELAAMDETKPWGAYYCISPAQTDRFLTEFFPGLTAQEAKLGRDEVELSPKLLVTYPGERLSWQYHHRRAERWHFLTAGHYYRSQTDDPGQPIAAAAGDVVQFDSGERHRLAANADGYCLVAEIWQHTDANQPSDEADIVRVQDDYQR